MRYRYLFHEECERIQEMDAAQYIGRAWRLVGEKRELVEIDYFDESWPNGYENHLQSLRDTITAGGVVLGVFDPDGKLRGFVSINPERFGSRQQYVLLDQLFISRECRGQGLGKKLLMQAKLVARRFGAQALYIAAGSAEETIAFYRACGCIDAQEVDAALLADDPRDLHLEYSVNKP